MFELNSFIMGDFHKEFRVVYQIFKFINGQFILKKLKIITI